MSLVTLLLLLVPSAQAAGGSLIYPHLISGMGFETRLVVRNGSGEAARVVLTARGDDGRVLGGAGVRNPVTVSVGAHQEVEVEAGELFGLSGSELRLGWVQGESENGQVTGRLYATTAAQGRGAGVEASGALETRLVGLLPRGMQAAMALANPNGVAAQVVVRLYDAEGAARGQREFPIAAQGHRSEFLSEGTGGALEGGHYEVESSVGLSGMLVLTGASGYTVAELGKATSGTLLFARVENGGEKGTTLAVANASGVGLEVVWRAYDAAGRAVWGEVRSRIGPHGTLERNVGVLFGQGAGEEFAGWVEGRVTASVENALEGVQAAGWALYAEGTGVGSLEAQRGTTGVQLLGGRGWVLNAGSTAVVVSAVGYGEDGRRVGSRTVTVGARQRVRLSEVAPAGSEMVLLRGAAGLVGYEERVDGSGVGRAQGAAALPAAAGAVRLSRELGGVVLAGDARARVEVPLGALSEDTVITIESLRAEETPAPPLGSVILAAVRVSPLGLRFGAAVRVEMPVLRTAPLAAGSRLHVYDPVRRVYERTEYEVVSGVGGTTLLASVREFPTGPAGTLWVVLGTAVGTPAGGGGGGGGGGGVISGGGGGTVSSGGSGGVVTSNDGQTSVVVPPGAVPQSTTITVAGVDPDTLPPPPNQQTVVLAAEVGPSGMQFQTPVTLQFQVPPALQGRLPRQLPVGIYNPLTSQYETTSFTAVLSADGATLTASVTHFTVFVLLQPFTPFAAPTLPSGTSVRPLGLVSVAIPAILDTAPPTVTINQAVGQPDPISASPITFAVVFSEPVTGFATGDVTLTGTAGATTATVAGSGAVYTVFISGMTASGTVSATIAASVATDLVGNPNAASTSTDNTVTFSLALPDLTIFKSHTGNFTPGQIGATYTIQVSNIGAGATFGTVTVTDTLPTGLTATAISGTGWSCVLATLTCTRSDALAPLFSYPDITLTVNIGSGVQNQGIFGAAFAGDSGDIATLYSISPTDGSATAIGPTTGFFQVSGLDFHPSGVLYGLGHRASDGEEMLITINTVTGAATEIGPLGVFGMWPDMAFRSDGALFGMRGINLHSINTATGAATLIGSTGLPGGTSGGGNGLAFSSADVLYLANGANLYTLDTTTAVPTLVTALDFSAFPDAINSRVNGMKFDPSTGVLWASVNDGTNNFLGTINIATGVVTNIGPTVTDLDALAILGSVDGIVNTVTVSGGGDSGPGTNTASDKVVIAAPFGPLINTIAGIGNAGFGGDNGPATSAQLLSPFGVAVDPSGNLFIAEDGANRIRRVDTSGVITTYAGTTVAGYFGDGGQATSAQLDGPSGIAVDAAGNLFIADQFKVVRRVDAVTNQITTVAGTATPGFSGDGGPATSAQMSGATGVAVDAIGNLYISDQGNQRIRKVNAATGIITTVAGNGTNSFSGDGGPATSAALNTPKGVAVDLFGNIYIADHNNRRIRKVDAVTGIITTVAGGGALTGGSSDGGPATSADLSSPATMTVDPEGDLFIAESGAVRKVDAITGIITTVAGRGSVLGDGGPAVLAELQGPSGLAVDSAGNLYISDLNAQRVRKVFGGATAGLTVAINQAATQFDPTSTSPINFRVAFNENVTGFATGDVVLSGTAGATTALVTGSGASYNVAVTGMTTSGTVIASIPAGRATGDITGLSNAASVSMDNTVDFVPLTFIPASGPEGSQVFITGAGFLDASLSSRVTQVFIAQHSNGATAPVAAASFTVLNDTSISAIVGSPVNTIGPVIVNYTDGSVATSAASFTPGALPTDLIMFPGFDAPDSVTDGEVTTLSFFVLHNQGGTPTDNTKIEVTLPSGMTFSSCLVGDPVGSSCGASGQIVTANFGTLPGLSGGICTTLCPPVFSGFVSIDVTVTNAGPSPLFLEVPAVASTTSAELTLTNNTGATTVTVNPAAGAPQSGGGPPGGIVNAFVIDPTTPDVIYAATTGAGIFKSTSSGSSWTPINSGLTNLNVLALAITPNPGTLYAGTDGGGVFKSTDGGVTWAAANGGSLTGGSPRISSLAVDANDSDIVYAGNIGGGVHATVNAGATWIAVNSGLVSTVVRNVLLDPFVPGLVYAATAAGISRSSNGGLAWTTINSGLTNTDVRMIALDPFDPAVIYAATGGGVFKSTNRGDAWTNPTISGLTSTNIKAVLLNPFVPDDILVGISGAGINGGVFRSTNGGVNWTAQNTDLNNLDVLALAFDANQQYYFAGTNGGGVYRGTGDPISWVVSNSGLTAATVTAMAIDPVTSSNVYASTQGAGVFKSFDGGANWFPINTGLQQFGQVIISLAVDPNDTNIVYAGDFSGNVWKTVDGGSNWAFTSSLPSFDDATATAIAIDPSTIPSTVYVATSQGSTGVSRSTNGGTTWTDFGSGLGLTTTAVNALVFDDQGTSMLYAGTNGGGVFSLDTSAVTPAWTQINSGLTGAELTIRSIAVEPDSNTVYVGTGGGGVSVTANSADIVNNPWLPVNSGLGGNLEIVSLAVSSPFTTLYAGTSSGGVFRTTNSGGLWSALNSGLPTSAVTKLLIDPSNVQNIFVGISRRGLFRTTDAVATPWQPTGDD